MLDKIKAFSDKARLVPPWSGRHVRQTSRPYVARLEHSALSACRHCSLRSVPPRQRGRVRQARQLCAPWTQRRAARAGALGRVEGRDRRDADGRRCDRHWRLIPGPAVCAHRAADRPGLGGAGAAACRPRTRARAPASCLTAASNRVVRSAAAAAAPRPPASAGVQRGVARAGHRAPFPRRDCVAPQTAAGAAVQRLLKGWRVLGLCAARGSPPRWRAPRGRWRAPRGRALRRACGELVARRAPGPLRTGQGPPAALPGQRGPGGCGACAQRSAPRDDAGGGRLQDVHHGRDHAERAHRAVRRPSARAARRGVARLQLYGACRVGTRRWQRPCPRRARRRAAAGRACRRELSTALLDAGVAVGAMAARAARAGRG